MSIDFVAVDVETANSDRGSICSKNRQGCGCGGMRGEKGLRGTRGGNRSPVSVSGYLRRHGSRTATVQRY